MATHPAHSFAFDTEQVCHLCGAHLDAAHLEETALGPVCLFCGMPASPATPQVEPAPSLDVGDALREARLLRGISLEDAAVDTCIRATHLRALEDDEPPKEYPGPVYARFFLQEYAEYLELDEGPLLAAFDRAIPEETVAPLESSIIIEPRGPRSWALTAAVTTLALILVLVLSRSGQLRGTPGPTTAAVAPHAAPAPSVGLQETPPLATRGESSSPATQAPSNGIRVVIGVSAPCWIQAVVDGAPTTGRTVPAGATVRFHARRSVELTLGNAGGAAVRVNGVRYPTGPAGQVHRISFQWRHGELIAS